MWKKVKQFLQQPIGGKPTIEKSIVDEIEFEAQGLTINLPVSDLKEYALEHPEANISVALAVKAYQMSPVINGSINYIAEQASTVPFKVAQINKKTQSTNLIVTGEPYRMLNYVNPNMVWEDLMLHTVSWYKLLGEAYWCIEPTPKEYAKYSPLSIYVLNPMYLKIVPHPETGYMGFVYEINGKEIYIPRENVIQFKNWHPKDHWFGHINLQSLSTDIQVERYGKAQAKNYFRNSAFISGFLSIPDNLDAEHVKMLEKQFYRMHKGTDNAYRVMVLTEGMTYSPFRSVSDQQNTNEIVDASVEAMTYVLGVPEQLLSGNIKANVDIIELEALFWNKTMLPTLTKLYSTMTKYLALPVHKNLHIIPDLSKVVALQLHDLNKARVEVARLNSGSMSINEVRNARGEPDFVDADDEEFTKFVNGPIPYYKMKMSAKEDATDASENLTLAGSEGGRDDVDASEGEMIDTTGTR